MYLLYKSDEDALGSIGKVIQNSTSLFHENFPTPRFSRPKHAVKRRLKTLDRNDQTELWLLGAEW